MTASVCYCHRVMAPEIVAAYRQNNLLFMSPEKNLRKSVCVEPLHLIPYSRLPDWGRKRAARRLVQSLNSPFPGVRGGKGVRGG